MLSLQIEVKGGEIKRKDLGINTKVIQLDLLASQSTVPPSIWT